MGDNDNTSTTYEEAKLCPRCKRTGRVVRITKATNSQRQPVELHLIACTTQLCPWFNTTYVVQVNDDGSIPSPYSQLGDKKYPRLSQESVSKIEDSIREQLGREVSGNQESQEVRNPRGR